MNIETGQDCYLSNGQKVIYVGEFEGSKLVRTLIQYGDEDGYEIYPSSDITTVADGVLHEKPPIAIYDQKIEDAKKALREVQEDISVQKAELREAKSRTEAQRKEDAKYPDLSRVFDIIDGKMTHCVIEKYSGPEIWKLDKFLIDGFNQYELRENSFKMLCLFGSPKEPVEFRINQYKDGSGTWTTVNLFKSKEGAISFIREEFAKAVVAWRERDKSLDKRQNPFYRVTSFLKADLKFEIPDDVQQEIALRTNKNRDDAVEKATEALREAEALPRL